jgi:hypothetical protein
MAGLAGGVCVRELLKMWREIARNQSEFRFNLEIDNYF